MLKLLPPHINPKAVVTALSVMKNARLPASSPIAVRVRERVVVAVSRNNAWTLNGIIGGTQGRKFRT